MTKRTGPLNWTLPPPAAAAAGWLRARLAGDRGEVGIVGTIILVVGFAVAAGALVLAVTGKLDSLIRQIPG